MDDERVAVEAPERIWLEHTVEGCRKHWREEPNERRAGLAHTNIEYVRADSISAITRENAALREALEECVSLIESRNELAKVITEPKVLGLARAALAANLDKKAEGIK